MPLGFAGGRLWIAAFDEGEDQGMIVQAPLAVRGVVNWRVGLLGSLCSPRLCTGRTDRLDGADEHHHRLIAAAPDELLMELPCGRRPLHGIIGGKTAALVHGAK